MVSDPDPVLVFRPGEMAAWFAAGAAGLEYAVRAKDAGLMLEATGEGGRGA